MSRCVVLAGLSGAGRSVAAGALEDEGWFVVDNLPGALISQLASLAGSDPLYSRVALVLSEHAGNIVEGVELIRSEVDLVSVLFLEASTETLIGRYEATKRRHPAAGTGSLADAIRSERRSLAEVRAGADLVIDTTGLNPHELRQRVRAFVDPERGTGMMVALESFGFKHGLPRDVDLVFDCRFLPNPYWESQLRFQTGMDAAVQAYVMESPEAMAFVESLKAMLAGLLPAYEKEGKASLTIAFGCTGGQHRSVAMVEYIAGAVVDFGWRPNIRHRDLPAAETGSAF